MVTEREMGPGCRCGPGKSRRLTCDCPTPIPADGGLKPQLKELVMNETSQTGTELQIVELGDAKEVTMGVHVPHLHEEDPLIEGQYA
jgi:hypothetical protein